MRKLLAGLGMAAMSGCGAVTGAVEEVCGPCPDVAEGELLVTGSAQIDGVFKALNTFTSASANINADFEGHVTALADAFGVVRGEGEDLATFAANVQAEVSGELSANAELSVDYVPPQCTANVSVAVEASAECKVEAGCTVDPGDVAVTCEGQCSGGCSAACTGSCAIEAPSVVCKGSCEGACNLEAGGACSGTCNGTCDGTCSATASDGTTCKGTCTGGPCTGSCELAVAASCDGTCSGKCVAEMGGAMCEGECRGGCEGSCSGSCAGRVEPPSVDCEANADCNAQASAQASASLECTPPRLDIDYSFTGMAAGNLDAQAEFLAKLTVFKTEVIGIVQGLFKARLLVEGDADLNIPAVQDILLEVAGSIDAEAVTNMTPYGAVCAALALDDIGAQIEVSATTLVDTVTAQASFAAMLAGG